MSILKFLLIFIFIGTPWVYAQEEKSLPAIVNAALDQVQSSKSVGEGAVRSSEPQTVTKIFAVKYISPQDAADKVRDVMGSVSGEVLVHEQDGQIEVTAPQTMIDHITTLMRDLDQDRQMEIEVKMVQVDLNEEHRQGINWSAIVSEYKSFVAIDDNRSFSMGTISKDDLEVLLDALDTVGDTKEYPRQTIKISSNQKSDLRIKAFGKNATVSLNPLKTTVAGSAERQDRYSARFVITPSAKGTDLVSLSVASQKPAETMLDVKKDNIVVLGGVFTQTKQESTKKFPFLGDIPVFGVVFRDQSREVHRIENIIFITPHILTTREK